MIQTKSEYMFRMAGRDPPLAGGGTPVQSYRGSSRRGFGTFLSYPSEWIFGYISATGVLATSDLRLLQTRYPSNEALGLACSSIHSCGLFCKREMEFVRFFGHV